MSFERRRIAFDCAIHLCEYCTHYRVSSGVRVRVRVSVSVRFKVSITLQNIIIMVAFYIMLARPVGSG